MKWNDERERDGEEGYNDSRGEEGDDMKKERERERREGR